MKSSFDYSSNPLIVLEVANNHQGDVEHGLKIIQEFSSISKNFLMISILQLNFSIEI